MPRLTDKETQRRELWALFVAHGSKYGWTHPETRRLLMLHEGFTEERYMHPRQPVPKSNWAAQVLPQYSEERWRTFTRMEPTSFQFVLDLIKDNHIFTNKSNCEQDLVSSQLKIALYKLAHDGSGSGYVPASGQWGVSEGHISNCVRRVVYALFQLREKYIRWPLEDERRNESLANQERAGFLGAVGKADGTDIVLHYKPGGELLGEHFFNRKKRYAIDLCAICDSDKRITYMLTGFSNAMHDARVWGHTNIHRNPTAYLSPGQYILGDAAYTPTKYMVPPYKAPEANRSENHAFNKQLSHIRIDIEHTFGMLKGRWKSLTGMRLIITDNKKYEFACM